MEKYVDSKIGKKLEKERGKRLTQKISAMSINYGITPSELLDSNLIVLIKQMKDREVDSPIGFFKFTTKDHKTFSDLKEFICDKYNHKSQNQFIIDYNILDYPKFGARGVSSDINGVDTGLVREFYENYNIATDDTSVDNWKGTERFYGKLQIEKAFDTLYYFLSPEEIQKEVEKDIDGRKPNTYESSGISNLINQYLDEKKLTSINFAKPFNLPNNPSKLNLLLNFNKNDKLREDDYLDDYAEKIGDGLYILSVGLT